jgi:hypothetical protein
MSNLSFLLTNMAQTIDITGLTPQQAEQISMMVEAFKAVNQQKERLSQGKLSEFDPTSLVFESEVIQPFNRVTLYGSRI